MACSSGAGDLQNISLNTKQQGTTEEFNVAITPNLNPSADDEVKDTPSLSKYFGTSKQPAASIFDEIATKTPGPVVQSRDTAMMSSVLGGTAVVDAPVINEISGTQSVVRSGISSNNLGPTEPTNKKDEPQVCTIFSEMTSSNGKTEKAFFDMLTPAAAVALSNNPNVSTTLAQPMVEIPDDPFLTPSPSEDIFSKAIHQSESDRRHDAWIPSKSTKEALIGMAESPPGTFFPERDQLTMPGVVMGEEMGDAVHELVHHYLGEEEANKRRVLTANDVTQDDRGLRQLIQEGYLRAAVNLTSQLLAIYGQGPGRGGHPSKHTAHSVQLWFTRIALLVRLRLFSLAEVEAEPFGTLDQPDLYFQFSPEMYGGRTGSMAPFHFRLLLAELPQYNNKQRLALERLYALLATVRQIIKNLDKGLLEDGSQGELSPQDRADSRALWFSRELRTLCSITNCAIFQKDYELAVQTMILLAEKDTARQGPLHSALGHLFLKIGDVVGAEKHFQKALELKAIRPVDALIDQGLVGIAQNSFQEAYECFKKAADLEPSNYMVSNNMAVCLLYLGRLKEAIALYEKCVSADPKRCIHESVLVNMCSLYELEGLHPSEKKLSLLSLLSQHKGDSIHLGCLKLQM